MNRQRQRITEAQVRRELRRGLRRAGRRRARIGATVVLALALLAGALAARFLVLVADVRTFAMSGALCAGDILLCDRMDSPLAAERFERGALALVRYSESGIARQAVRRIAALPGDEVSVAADGRLTVNGAPVEEPHASYRPEGDGLDAAPGGALDNPFLSAEEAARQADQDGGAATAGTDDQTYPLAVPEGKLFVLCDDRSDLMDSRSSAFGLVDRADVLGWPRMVIWPVYRAGTRVDGR